MVSNKKGNKDNPSKQEYHKKYREYLTSFKTVKTSLKSIVKDPSIIKTLNDAVLNINKIRIHTYQFIKLYFLKRQSNNQQIPILTKDLIYYIMKLFCDKKSSGRKRITLKEKNVKYKQLDNELQNENNKLDDINKKINDDKDNKDQNNGIDKNLLENRESLKKKINSLKSQLKNLSNNIQIDSLSSDIQNFYKNVYKKTMIGNEQMTSTHLDNVLKYEAESMLTNYENHIINHFVDFLTKFIIEITDVKATTEIIKNDKTKSEQVKEKQIKDLWKSISVLQIDILQDEDNCNNLYTAYKQLIRGWFNKPNDQTLLDEIKKYPLKYFKGLIKMSNYSEVNHETPLNWFPLQKSAIPKYINIDTVTIIHLLFPKDMKKGHYLNEGNMSINSDFIWYTFFKTDKKVFHAKKNKRNGKKRGKEKEYVFNKMISTDGLGCSILLIREDLYNPNGKNMVQSMRKPYGFKMEKYIDELTEDDKNELKSMKIIGCDPGKEDLIMCTSGKITKRERKNGKIKYTMETFRYSQNQRRKETKMKDYKKHLERTKPINVKNKETLLSKHNFKTCIYQKTLDCIKIKIEVNWAVHKHYEGEIYRKYKWFSFINKQKSESKMINHFKEKFGDHTKAFLAIGDWEQKQQMRFKEPTIGKGMRNIFRRAHYQVYLVDEFKTSKMNYITKTINEKFRYKKNPKKYKKGEILCHGLLRSKNDNKSGENLNVLVNRDKNAAYLIGYKAKCAIENKPLPEYLRRNQ